MDFDLIIFAVVIVSVVALVLWDIDKNKPRN
jgi:hypothetical protein